MTPLISRKVMGYRPQEVGKIKLGRRGQKKKTSGGADMFQPMRLDHFEIVTREREGRDGAFVRDEAIHAIVGEEPTELEGTLGFHEIEDNLHTSMRVYAGRRAKIKCNGEVMRTKEGVESPCKKPEGAPCPEGCKPYCRLHLQLHASPYTGGYHTFRTRSWESTNNIQTFLEETFARFNTLFQAPVKLICYQSEDQYELDGKDMTGKSTKVALVLNMPYETAMLHMVQAKERLEAMKERLLITGSQFARELDEQDDEDEQEIADEFSPPKELDASVGTQEKLEEVVAGLEPVEPPDPDSDVSEGEYEVVEEDEEADEGGASELANLVMDLRDEANSMKLLDRTAKQFVKDALDSGEEESLDKARRALDRLLTRERLKE